jgi:hypothetical protein
MGGDPKARRWGLKLYWMSPLFQRERFSTIWYKSTTTRDKARKDFENETLGGKPRYSKIEELTR